MSLIGKRVAVLDKGWVELVDFMPHPATGVSGDLAIVNAARVSFMGDSKGEERDKKLLFYLMRHEHTSPFEMVEFKFRVKAPLLVWWQLVRHRTFSLNLQSGRYTGFAEDELYIPDEWRKQSASNKQGSSDKVIEEDEFISMMETTYGDVRFYWADEAETLPELFREYASIGYQIYTKLLIAGAAREQARLFLPGFAVYYTGIIKVDAHNLMRFLRLRMASEAQLEIREYADAIHRDFFTPLLPWTAEAFDQYALKEK